MICPHCGKALPEGQEFKFCIFCGAAMTAPEAAPAAPAVTPEEAPRTEAPVQEAPVYEAPVSQPEPPVQAPKKAPKPPKVRKEKKSGGHTGGLVALAILLVLALGAAGFLGYCAVTEYYDVQELEAASDELTEQLAKQKTQLDAANADKEKLTEQVSQLEDDVAALEGDVESMDSEMAETSQQLEDDLDAANAKAELFDVLSTDYKGHYFGFGSGNFFVNKAVLVASLSKNEEPMLTLNTTWPEGGTTVNVSYEGDAAHLEFTEESWGDAVNMKMIPQEEGFTVATFTTDTNKETFEVLLIVTK